MYLFTPMITVWGRKVYEIDGSPSPDTLDASRTSFVNNARKYFIMPTNWPNDTMINTVSGDLQVRCVHSRGCPCGQRKQTDQRSLSC